MTEASAKSGSDARSSAALGCAEPNGVSAKQEQQNGPVLKSPQQSRAATPELKIERLDVRTGQVRCSRIHISSLFCHLYPSKLLNMAKRHSDTCMARLAWQVSVQKPGSSLISLHTVFAPVQLLQETFQTNALSSTSLR